LVWKNSPKRLLFQLMDTTSFSMSSARPAIKVKLKKYYICKYEFKPIQHVSVILRTFIGYRFQ
jgi:hypothetical protein